MRFPLLSTILFISLFQLTAQNAIPIGKWRAHLPYQVGSYVTQSADEIIYTTGLSLVFLSKEDGAPRFLSKTDGLSDVGIDLVRYNPFGQYLVIAYENSVMDIYDEGQIEVRNQIRNFTNLTGGRKINDIVFADENIALIAAEYGISKVDLPNGNFLFTAFTGGLNVTHTISHEGYMYAATPEGYYRVREDVAFPEDFTQWERLAVSAGFPEDYTAGPLRLWQGELYMGIDNDIYRFSADGPELFYTGEPDFPLDYLSAEGRLLLAGYGRPCDSNGNCTADGRAFYFSPEGEQGRLSPGCTGNPQYALEDENGAIWFGDRYRNFRSIPNATEEICRYRTFNSPWSEKSWAIDVSGDESWITAGALSAQLTGRFFREGFYRLHEGAWRNYNDENTDVLDGMTASRGDDFFDPIDIAINEVTNKVYVASQYEGIVEIDEDRETMRQYTFENSPLEESSRDPGRTYIGGVTTDEDGNTWIANQSPDGGRVIHQIDPDGNWSSYAPCGPRNVRSIVVDPSHSKWLMSGDESGLVVFNEGNPDDPSDDQCRNIRTNNSVLPTNDIRSLAVDLRGDVWVGTTAGIVIFDCGGNVFNSSQCLGTRRVVQFDGFGAFLLENETVQAIAVDGANRKWIGTTNGIFLLSDDGKEQLLRFTEDNSPLFDDNIRDIAINDKTGEVWFATDKGTLSYQGDAVLGNRLHNAKIEVFPNPVRPDYAGPITIRGLAQDANVKITDITGQMIYEARALGGQFIWNGTDYNGRRAQTGVYLVFSTSNPRQTLDNPDTAVAKILFVN